VARVGVQFEIDANGILHVLARDVKTGKQTQVEMKSAVDVEDAAVQKMVEESVEHAFEDMAARRWVEAKLKAEQLVEATRKGLKDCADGLEPDYRARVELSLASVSEALAAEDPQTRTGDVVQLKAACDALDRATAPLAEMLMDRVTEALLRRRGVIG